MDPTTSWLRKRTIDEFIKKKSLAPIANRFDTITINFHFDDNEPAGQNALII